MSTKPGAFALSKEATNFVFSNIPLFFSHIKVVFPLIVLCAVAKQAGLLAGHAWVSYIVAVATLFLYGCFALGWHRSSLRGADAGHERNPFNLKGEDWGFIAMFMGITGGFGLSIEGLNQIVSKHLPQYGDGITALGSILILVLMAYLLVTFIRASFLFPARSVGVKLSWSDARRSSKGLIWPLIGTNLIFALLFVVAFTVYGFVAGFVATVAGEGHQLEQIQAITIGLIIALPIMIGAFLMVALCISALSRAYQWGIQNNN